MTERLGPIWLTFHPTSMRMSARMVLISFSDCDMSLRGNSRSAISSPILEMTAVKSWSPVQACSKSGTDLPSSYFMYPLALHHESAGITIRVGRLAWADRCKGEKKRHRSNRYLTILVLNTLFLISLIIKIHLLILSTHPVVSGLYAIGLL